ncbi:MAG: peroxiredoxin family protein [Gemmataceae bacterium]
MNRLALGVLALLLAWPPLRGEDEQPSFRQQYDALVKESQQARQDYFKASREAKTDEERQKAAKEHEAKTRRIAAGLLALAEKAPKDSVSINALSKVFALDGSAHEKMKAAALLLRDYLPSDKIAPICQSLALKIDDTSETLLRTILAKNPHKSIRAEASFALAHMLDQRFYVAKEIQRFPEDTQQLERIVGKEVVEEVRKKDVDALESDAAKTWSEFAEKYSADIPEQRLRSACAWLSFSETNEVDTALRILEKDKRRAIQGIACLTLGQILKRRADALAAKDDKAAAKLRAESAAALHRASDKYGDVKIMWGEQNFGALIGDQAKSELYELRHLSIGRKAPEIDSEDQDGKKFKLSDYKGKVVLLDFWSPS